MHFSRTLFRRPKIPFHFTGFTEPPVWTSTVEGDLLMGKVKLVTTVGLQRTTCLKVRVPQNNFHEYNRMFHVTSAEHWTLDPESQCRAGDVVLIRRAEEHERPSTHVEYIVKKVMFAHGNFIDPITKRRVFGANEFEREVELRKGFVKEIFNEPLADKPFTEEEEGEDEPITHEKRRGMLKQTLELRKNQLKSRTRTADPPEDLSQL